MKSGFTAVLLAITLSLGCGGVAGAAPNANSCNAPAKSDFGTKNGTSFLDCYSLGERAFEREEYSKAHFYLFPLAKAGHGAAQRWVGDMTLEGKGALQNYKEAMNWYRLAYQHGFINSGIGKMYERGLGVSKDPVRAYLWYDLSQLSSFGSPDSREQRDRVAAKMTPAQIAEAQAMARKCQASNFKQCD